MKRKKEVRGTLKSQDRYLQACFVETSFPVEIPSFYLWDFPHEGVRVIIVLERGF